MDTSKHKTPNGHENKNFVDDETSFKKSTTSNDNTPNEKSTINSNNNVNNTVSNHQTNKINTITNNNTEISNNNEQMTNNNTNNLSPKWRFYNIVLLGVIFMLIFTAFQTCSMVQVLVLEGANIESNNSAGNGYTSLAIVYGSFSLSNWLAAYIVEVLTAKWGLFIGGLTYCIFLGWFLRPHQITLYLFSALLGFGAAVLWAAQGKFLSINSTEETMSRNTNVFWGLFQSCLIWGNLIIIHQFSSLTIITKPTRTSLFIILTVVSGVGVLGVIFLRKRKQLVAVEEEIKSQPLKIFKRSFQIMFSKDMLLLSVIFLYTGIELAYLSVLVTSVGHMTFFKSESKQLAGLCGLFIGFGQISSSFFFILASSFRHLDKRLVLLAGFVAHVVTFFIVFTTFPSESPLVETDALTYFQPSKALVFVSSFLLGFGDSCINTQIYPTLRQLYLNDIASACALFKFLQSLACTSSFVYSSYAFMEIQLGILSVLLFIGTLLFFLLENRRLNR